MSGASWSELVDSLTVDAYAGGQLTAFLAGSTGTSVLPYGATVLDLETVGR